MQIGAVYPQVEIETDPGAVQHFAQAAEEMGFTHLLVFDHVLGANRASRPDAKLPYDLDSPFHEPLVLFAFLAGKTTKLGFATGVMILTQRQAALVAKQAASVDVLSNGRLRLGVGTGWNAVEYEALGADYATRGARIEEQVAVMRALWSQRAVTFHGEQHRFEDAGILPMPVQQPIPLWFGGGSDRAQFGASANLKVLRRIARLGDGWIQQAMPMPRVRELIGTFHGYLREYGRDPASVGVECRMSLPEGGQDGWAAEVESFRAAGATHLAVSTLKVGLHGVDAHLKRLELFRQAVPAGG